jgi:hypothetical protein
LPKEISPLREKGEVVGLKIDDREFYADELGFVEMQVDELKGFDISSIPEDVWLRPLKGETIIFEGEISSTARYPGVARMEIQGFRKYWYHKFGASQYFAAMRKAIKARKKSAGDVRFVELEDDGARLLFRYEIFLRLNMPVEKAFRRFREIVQEIQDHTERVLNRAEIPSEALQDEKRYANEVLLPLYRSMGFTDVRYSHGEREFGKDITFSELDRFGVLRNYGVQVKIGDVSGEAASEIDKIVGQVDDAFSMPYIDTTSREKRYISDLIIAVSGRFTENAKEKMVEKAKRRNILFLDIDKTQELLTRYMK